MCLNHYKPFSKSFKVPGLEIGKAKVDNFKDFSDPWKPQVELTICISDVESGWAERTICGAATPAGRRVVY